jgi:hypothetical protein
MQQWASVEVMEGDVSERVIVDWWERIPILHSVYWIKLFTASTSYNSREGIVSRVDRAVVSTRVFPEPVGRGTTPPLPAGAGQASALYVALSRKFLLCHNSVLVIIALDDWYPPPPFMFLLCVGRSWVGSCPENSTSLESFG